MTITDITGCATEADEQQRLSDLAAIARAGRLLWRAAEFDKVAVPQHPFSADYQIAEDYPKLVDFANQLDSDTVQFALSEWKASL